MLLRDVDGTYVEADGDAGPAVAASSCSSRGRSASSDTAATAAASCRVALLRRARVGGSSQYTRSPASATRAKLRNATPQPCVGTNLSRGAAAAAAGEGGASSTSHESCSSVCTRFTSCSRCWCSFCSLLNLRSAHPPLRQCALMERIQSTGLVWSQRCNPPSLTSLSLSSLDHPLSHHPRRD